MNTYYSNGLLLEGLAVTAYRRLQIRSLLCVNEEFASKQSFEDDPLSQQRTHFVVRRVAYLASIKSLGWMGHT